ncbi:MAG: GAF domain-containing sensor histidine kinase [Candidatus Pacebacteria bacterium]|nr:GAF domain-containing sensor histidine kinase [Candidatus Paceibacterota bacterium]
MTIQEVNDSALKFLVPLDLAKTYELVAQEGVRLTDADYAYLNLKSPNGIALTQVAQYPHAAPQLKLKTRGYAYQSWKDRKAFLISGNQFKKIHFEPKFSEVELAIYLPISDHLRSSGVLVFIFTKKQKITKQQLKLLELFGSYASLAIWNAKLYEDTRNALLIRDHFISVAAHELRTPLTSINGYIQLLYKKFNRTDSSEGRWIKALYSESLRMTGLIKELLEINRIKAGQLQFNLKECSLGEIIKKAQNHFQKLHLKRSLIINNYLDKNKDVIIADREKLTQVIFHLLENAAKFSPVISSVEMEIKKDGKDFLIVVKDKGKGIPFSDLPLITSGFYKIDVDADRGLGVGLLFAKNVVTYHRGTIAINSELNKGTEVQIRIPAVSD